MIKKCKQCNKDFETNNINAKYCCRECLYKTFQKCLERGLELNAHHVENFADNKNLRFNIANGTTFCRECHYRFHKIYGFNNNNLQLKEFLAVGEEE